MLPVVFFCIFILFYLSFLSYVIFNCVYCFILLLPFVVMNKADQYMTFVTEFLSYSQRP